MKKIMVSVIVLLMGVVLATSPSFALTYTIIDSIGRDPLDLGPWPGGTFNNVTTGELTFCLELNERLAFNTPYLGTIDEVAIGGGLGGGTPDPLDSRSKWLYGQFLSNPGAYTIEQQIALQLAFWSIEGEFVGGEWKGGAYDFSGFPSEIRDQATDYISSSTGHDDPNIKVLNLYESNARVENRQSLLTRVPEPGTLFFLGTGLIGLAFALRRRKS